ncbi:MAG: hypothetical protein JST54_17715 [Deltaproteobacteria bacterium]|nr:hypothetical protein [Deltaproteobacteria bacterium]
MRPTNPRHRGLAAAVAIGLALFLASCGGTDPLSNVGTVQSARVTGVKWSGFDVVVGWSWASGTLEVVDLEGQAHAFPVKLSGPAVGVVFDFDGESFGNGIIDLHLPPGKTLHGTDLTGQYFGSEEALQIGIGVESHNLKNSSGVTIDDTDFGVGIGVFAAGEWIDLSEQ